MLNKTINGYTIKHLIGSGGMAEVYYAENSLGFPAAIKVLKREFSQHAQVQERFVNEAKIMKSLNHPYIRKVMDLGNINGQACIIMEYLEGRTLKELMLSGKRINDATLQKYFDQCAQALMYTHAQKITHRDIKPSNIFITNSDEVRLVDFGIAKSDLTLSKTITGQTLGTVMYMSSEQVTDPKRVTGKTDIYSLGVTFYHVLTGTPPYDETTGSEFVIQRKIVDENLDLSGIPLHWQLVLSGCLHKKPEERTELKAKNFENDTVVDLTAVELPPNQRKLNYKIWLLLIGTGVLFIFGILWVMNISRHKDVNAEENATEMVDTLLSSKDAALMPSSDTIKSFEIKSSEPKKKPESKTVRLNSKEVTNKGNEKTEAENVATPDAKNNISVEDMAVNSENNHRYIVVCGSYLVESNAIELKERIQMEGIENVIVTNFNFSQYHSVCIDNIKTEDEARAISVRLKTKGFYCYVKKRLTN